MLERSIAGRIEAWGRDPGSLEKLVEGCSLWEECHVLQGGTVRNDLTKQHGTDWYWPRLPSPVSLHCWG